jgi:hypothetical protein
VLALSGLATIYVADVTKREKARQLMLDAIEHAQKLVGPKHVLTALAYHNMGYVCKCSELYNEAETWYQKALELRKYVHVLVGFCSQCYVRSRSLFVLQ